MSLLDIFKRKPSNWEVFKNFLIKDCMIPFNKLHSIEACIKTIIDTIKTDNGISKVYAINGINEDDKFIIQMGIAAQLADEKYATAILANEGNETELNEALNQWKTKDCKINIGQIQNCKSKKGRAYINLYNSLESSEIKEGILYIYDASFINQDISTKEINI